MTVYHELVRASSTVGYKLQLEGQTDEAWIKGLAFAIAAIDDSIWKSLSPAAQEWYQEMSKKVKLPFDQWPTLEGFKGREKEPDKPKGARAPAVERIRQLVMMRPMISAREVHKLVEATVGPGIKFETVSVIVSETKSLIKTAQHLGFWRDQSIYEGQKKLTVEEAAKQFPVEGTSIESSKNAD